MLVSALEAHRIWAENYDTNPNPLLALERRVMSDLLTPTTAMRVVDVACGTGRWMTWFANTGATVFGVEVCEEMLGQAPSNLHGSFALGCAEHLPISANTADLIVCSFAAGYFPRLEQAIAEMARITRSGGNVVIADLHPAGVAAGWTRSFRAGGRVYEIEHCAYSLQDFIASADRAGLTLARQVHACFGEPERPVFEMAGRPERFEQVRNIPAIWAGRWRKP
jgi:ubiquinone/menaquinone biosynthesis C-methylase UbiE